MPNSLFLVENFLDTNTALTASSSAPAMPVGNLANTQRNLLWRSGTGTTSFVDLTMSNTFFIDALAFVDVNLTTGGTIRIQAYSNAIGGTVVFDQTISPTVYSLSQTRYLYGGGLYGVGNYSSSVPLSSLRKKNVTIYELPSKVFARYWRFTFTDANTTFQQLSRIYVSQAFRFRINLALGWSAQRQERSPKKESLGGQIYTQQRDSRLQIQGQYDFLSDDERTRALLFMEEYGETIPIIFSIFPENNNIGLTTSLYGTLEGANTTQDRIFLNNFNFSVTETL